MKLLFLNHNVARRGGTFFRAHAVARELARRGHDVSLLAVSPSRRWGSDRRVVDGVEVIETPDLLWGVGRTGWDPFDTLWRCAFLRGRQWDVVHAWDSRPAVILPALFARRQSAGAPLIMDWADWFGRGGTQAERGHGLAQMIYGPVETYFEEAFRTRADGSTAISQALLERAVRLGVPAGSIRLLPQGCDVHLEPLPDGAAFRAAQGIAPGEPLYVTVGRLLPGDASVLFEAAADVLRREPAARFVLIGRHGATIPAALRASGRVTETGFVSDDTLRNYMAACDALAVPLADTIASRARWPSKTNGFLAAGRAVVISRVGDLPALLEREQAAFVADPNPPALAEALLTAARDPERRANVEQRARRLARERLAWPVVIDGLLAFYEQVARVPTLPRPLEGAKFPVT